MPSVMPALPSTPRRNLRPETLLNLFWFMSQLPIHDQVKFNPKTFLKHGFLPVLTHCSTWE